MKKRIVLVCCMIFATMLMTGCCFRHEFEEATCKDPQTCIKCGKTVGEPLDHEWKDATCEEPKTCELCGKKKGEAKGHEWEMATCTTPMTCSVCGATEGEAYGHYWNSPNCTEARTCYTCGESDGVTGEHYWLDATCENPQTCYYCGETIGEALSHHWVGDTYVYCDNCYNDLPDDEIDNGFVSWKGAQMMVPEAYVMSDATTDTTGYFVNDSKSEVLMVNTHWNKGWSYDLVVGGYGAKIEEVYDIVEEGEVTYGDNDFYEFKVTHESGAVGYCVIFWREDVFVYIEYVAYDQDTIDRLYHDTMETFHMI